MEQELYNATRFGKKEKCEELLREGANINYENSYGNTPLSVAIKNHNIVDRYVYGIATCVSNTWLTITTRTTTIMI